MTFPCGHILLYLFFFKNLQFVTIPFSHSLYKSTVRPYFQSVTLYSFFLREGPQVVQIWNPTKPELAMQLQSV